MARHISKWMREPPAKAPIVLPPGFNPHLKEHRNPAKRALLQEAHQLIDEKIRQGAPLRLPTSSLARKYGFHPETIASVRTFIGQSRGIGFARGGPNSLKYGEALPVIESEVQRISRRGKNWQPVDLAAIRSRVRAATGIDMPLDSVKYHVRKLSNGKGWRHVHTKD